jgi:hypothetical protein
VAGGAAFGTDYTQTGAATYTATTGSVTFAAGNSTATVTIDPSTDVTVEPDETVILTVTSGTGYSVGSPSAVTGTIVNDDGTTGGTLQFSLLASTRRPLLPPEMCGTGSVSPATASKIHQLIIHHPKVFD